MSSYKEWQSCPQGFSFSLVAMSTRIRLFFETAYSLCGYRVDRALNLTEERCPDSLVSGGGKDNWCKKKYADSKISGHSLKLEGR